MKAIIKSIRLSGFKGCKSEKEYRFNGKNAVALGNNGTGKTTIGTGYYWVFADTDAELKSNPMIRCLGAEDVTPRVEIVLDIDGREISVAKIQKRTIKKSKDGKESVSLSNTYEVNAVEYGERDFKAKLAEYGFDTSLFLALAHPDVFTGQKSADMRKVLFSMASSKSDYDMASMTEGAEKATEMLKNYSVDEVRAMQNATIRKIKEVYGDEGEILRATIEGMERSKTDIDVAEIELQINSLNEQIAENKAKQDDVSKQFTEYQKLSDGIMELKFAEGDLERKANEELVSKKNDIRSQIYNKSEQVMDISNSIKNHNRDIDNLTNSIASEEKSRSRLAEQWKSVNAEAFDESTTICPTCHRELPGEEIETLRSNFAKLKAERLARIVEFGTEAKKNIEKAKGEVTALQLEVEKELADKEGLEKEIEELKAQLSELPASIDISDTEEYKAIQMQISEKEQAMSQMNSADDMRGQLKAELEDLQAQLMECKKKIALSEHDATIDEQIAELKTKQLEYEQSKADAEKILYQLKLVGKRKNELLSEEINAHFELVNFKLFDYQKNGEYKEVCVPQYKGKDMRVSTNTGLEIAMKLDIIKGLQKFYGLSFPVFIDGAECLSDSTRASIKTDCQLIYLQVPHIDGVIYTDEEVIEFNHMYNEIHIEEIA